MANHAAVVRPNQIAEDLQESIDRALARALAEDWVTRIWSRDATVWTDDDRVARLIADRLGWLDLPLAFADTVDPLDAFAAAVRSEGFAGAVVCGMGGSSLAP